MTARGFDPVLHKRVLTALLLEIYKTPGPAEKLVFKGGTCASFFYGLPRLSLDLDFDLQTPLEAPESSRLRGALERHAAVREVKDKANTLFFLLNYARGAPPIKIEAGKRVWRNNSDRPAWMLGVEMRIADERTLATNKLVALADRKNPVARDLFDARFFLKMGYPLNEALVRERTGKSLSDYLADLAAFVPRVFTAKAVLHGLGDVLDEKQKAGVKGRLVKDFLDEIAARRKSLAAERS
ncbi:MAG: nucleotidyl transferase AbiEii/AbiGii toxin family protein [Candidatus Aminicenantes bacterium]|nr:nucleotidyl transferase AbiEii/AbiGii toxin family protein [Candidatus Aminicenantes bacterium]